jgi:hypothetical protein
LLPKEEVVGGVVVEDPTAVSAVVDKGTPVNNACSTRGDDDDNDDDDECGGDGSCKGDEGTDIIIVVGEVLVGSCTTISESESDSIDGCSPFAAEARSNSVVVSDCVNFLRLEEGPWMDIVLVELSRFDLGVRGVVVVVCGFGIGIIVGKVVVTGVSVSGVSEIVVVVP